MSVLSCFCLFLSFFFVCFLLQSLFFDNNICVLLIIFEFSNNVSIAEDLNGASIDTLLDLLLYLITISICIFFLLFLIY